MSGFEDPYVYPEKDSRGKSVLKNKANIRDSEQLSEFEYEISSFRELQLKETPIKGNFDLEHLKEIHKKLFGDVYEWAGETRTVNMSKADTRFMPQNLIETFGDIVTDKLKNENHFRGLTKEKFVEGISNFYKTWNEIHPFREGNGRATRVFLEEVSKNAGYVFRQDVVERNKQLWNRAAARSITTNGNDQSELKALMSQIVVDSRAYHLAKTKPEIAIAKHPELLAVYADINNKLKTLDKTSTDFSRQKNVLMSSEFKRHIYEINTGRSTFITTPPGVNTADMAVKKASENKSQEIATKATMVEKSKSKGLTR